MNTASSSLNTEPVSIRGRARVNLDLDSKVKSRIENLRERSGATTLSEVVRRALVLYDVVLENYSKGGMLVFINDDGSEERVHIV
jgi:hypothetical protein